MNLNHPMTVPVRGLYTAANDLMAVPPGALLLAENIVLDRSLIAGPRPGFPPALSTFPVGAGTNRARAVYWYQDTLYVVVDTATPTLLQYSNGQWNTIGTFAYPASGVRTRFAEASKNLYLTTGAGVQVLDGAAGMLRVSGVQKGLDQSLAIAATGPLTPNSSWAYRHLWGARDANNNVKSGAPSGRNIVSLSNTAPISTTGNTNRAGGIVTVDTSTAHGLVVGQVVNLTPGDGNFASGNKTVATAATTTRFTYTEAGAVAASSVNFTFTPVASAVTVTVRIPSTITVNNFLQVYRTSQVTGTNPDGTPIDPGDTMQLVYEYVPLASDITAGTFAFSDIVPDAMLGQALYTNQTQEGIQAANEAPPLCTDICVYKNTSFYCNTSSKQRLTLSLLAVGGSAGMQLGDSFVIHDLIFSATTGNLTASAAENIAAGNFLMQTSGTPAQNIAATAQSLVRVINGMSVNSLCYAYYLSGPDDVPGRVLIEGQTLAVTQFVMSNRLVAASKVYFSPNVGYETTLSSLVRTGSLTVTVNWLSHGLSVGQAFVIRRQGGGAEVNFPIGVKYVASVIDTSHITYSEPGANATAASSYAGVSVPAVSQASNQTNGVAYGKNGQPEAVPLANQFNIGRADKALLRGIALRDSVFFFKEDGLFRLTGDPLGIGAGPGGMAVQVFDPTVNLILPESAVALGNQIYCLTSQGVVRVTETGVEIVSTAIGNLLPTVKSTALTSYGFAVGHESQRHYILFVDFTDVGTPTIPNRAYVFNTLKNEWTRWLTYRTAGAVEPATDKLWLADGKNNQVTAQIAGGTLLDYYDDTAGVTISAVSSNGLTVTLADGGSAPKVGDALGQGANYATITAVNGAVLTMAESAGFIAVGATLYRAYPCTLQWAPLADDGPGRIKQWSETALLFRLSNFSTATLAWATEWVAAQNNSLTGPSSPRLTGANIEGPLRTYVAKEASRCSQLSVSFTITNALAQWALQGFSVAFRHFSSRVGG